jgi:hypothetical protein
MRDVRFVLSSLVLPVAAALALGTVAPGAAAPLRVHAAAPLRAHGARPATVGSSNVATADPTVPRPDTKPCVVPLFSGDRFADFTPKPFVFTPPAACRGPWAKVVLELNLSVDAGIQFDRTATIGLDRATIFFGTTAEPSPALGPSWHVERDLTDLSALFSNVRHGQISIGNVVNSTYTSALHGSAELEFYPPDKRFPAPRVADAVVPLADANGNPVALTNSASALSVSFVPPTNVERAYLDVIAQSQNEDEFWYSCFPNNLATLLDNCGNTAFRETEVAVDGKPAGVAPVYPWIFTGGVDPYLWFPIPGVQTLNFTPYRVDLSPFAGTLDNGAKHVLSLSVYNADNYFQATGNLLLFLDRGAHAPLTGKVDTDTLAAVPPENLTEGGSFNSNGIGSGTIGTVSKRGYTIAGHVNTSHGLVTASVVTSLAFTQLQKITSTTSEFVQDIQQDTAIGSTSTISGSDGPGTVQTAFDWPLVFDYSYAVNANNTSAQTTSIAQGYSKLLLESGGSVGPGGFLSFTTDHVTPTDTLHFDSSGNLTSISGTAGSQTYTYQDTTGLCYGKRLTSAANVLTQSVKIGC